MTRNEILALEAGRELDAMVARAFGWTHVADYGPNYFEPKLNMWFGVPPGGSFVMLDGEPHLPSLIDNPLPRYSETWEGMRLVVEAMAKDGWRLGLCQADGQLPWFGWFFNGDLRHEASGNTAPHAVALAAMLAVGGGDAR